VAAFERAICKLIGWKVTPRLK